MKFADQTEKRIAEMLHGYTSTPLGGRTAGHITGALISQRQRPETEIESDPHHETSTCPLCHGAYHLISSLSVCLKCFSESHISLF